MTVQVQRVYIRATAERVWEAITSPDWTSQYGYGGRAEFDLTPGGAFQVSADADMQAAGMPAELLTGKVLEVDPPHRLVQTWNAGWNDEGDTTLTYEITQRTEDVVCLTVTHDLTGAPQTLAMVAGAVDGAGGGWAEVLSDLKTLLETGRPMFG